MNQQRVLPYSAYRILAACFASRPGTWVILNLFTPLDRLLLRLSRGRISTIAAGMPSLTLISIGAKSGRERETPLAYIPDGDRMVLIASNGGKPNHPAWYYNLRANPNVRVIVAGTERHVVAREVSGGERERLWSKASELYIGYAIYQTRTQGRLIPVFVLEADTTA